MAKAPAYPMYAQDYDMDTATFDNEEVGMYQRLLNNQWINGALPSDLGKLARIVRTSRAKFSKKWTKTLQQKFIENEQGLLINLRMEEVRQKLLNYRKSQAELGRAGAAKRWGKDKGQDGEPYRVPHQDPNDENMAFQFSSSSSCKNKEAREKKPRAHPPALALWFKTYKAKKAAEYFPSNFGEDTKHANWLLKSCGKDLELLGKLYRTYLADDDKFIVKSGWALRHLRQNFNGYKQQTEAPPEQDKAKQVFDEILNHISRHGLHQPIEGLDDFARKVLAKIGGPLTIGNTPNNKLRWVEQDFVNAWLDMKKTETFKEESA